MTQGTIKYWNRDRGFGIVTPDDGGPEVFCHFSKLADQSRIHLEAGERNGKPAASNVRVIS